jgi:hypothetical protein
VVGGRRCRPGGGTPPGCLRRALTSPDPSPRAILELGLAPVAFKVFVLTPRRVPPKAAAAAGPAMGGGAPGALQELELLKIGTMVSVAAHALFARLARAALVDGRHLHGATMPATGP